METHLRSDALHHEGRYASKHSKVLVIIESIADFAIIIARALILDKVKGCAKVIDGGVASVAIIPVAVVWMLNSASDFIPEY